MTVCVLTCGCFLVLLISGMACNRDASEIIPADPGYDYFPLAIGQSAEYVVDSILLDPGPEGTVRDTIRSFLREIITDTFRDAEYNLVYKVDHYWRPADSLPWMLNGTGFCMRDPYEAHYWDGALRFVALSFPIASGMRWDGLAHISPYTTLVVAGEVLTPFSYSPFELVTSGTPMTVGGVRYEQTCTVEASQENLIEKRLWKAVYARGAGLVLQEFQVYDTQNLNSSVSWDERAEKGFFIRKTRIVP